ncbi:MAG: hypothetical protein KAT62_11365 [Desulfuromonadales bacterium]|nr:hypothetical protein [Desulfuromonadales bacterium]
MKDAELQQALLKMLQAELDAMHYYQQASRFMQDEAAIYHFNLLAQEELEHARTFYSVYPGDDLPSFEELVKNMSDSQAATTIDPQLMGRLNEQTALQLAQKMEEEVAEVLKQLLSEVSNPAAQAVIQENIDSTLGHLELIQDDYQRIFGNLLPG